MGQIWNHNNYILALLTYTIECNCSQKWYDHVQLQNFTIIAPLFLIALTYIHIGYLLIDKYNISQLEKNIYQLALYDLRCM